MDVKLACHRDRVKRALHRGVRGRAGAARAATILGCSVLLTNDDGIEAEGLQTLRRALVALPTSSSRSWRPTATAPRWRASITTRRPLWVQEVDFERRHDGLRDRRHAGRLRAARQARAHRGLRRPTSSCPASTTARTSATTSPTRARSPPRSRAIMLGLPAIAVSQQSTAREMDFRLGSRVRLRGRRASSSPASSASSTTCRSPQGTLLNVNVPAGEPEGVEVTRLGKRIYRDELKLAARTRTRAPPLLDLRRRPGLPRRAGDRPRRDRRRAHRGHAAALRPHRRRGHRTRSRRTTSRGCSPRPRARCE